MMAFGKLKRPRKHFLQITAGPTICKNNKSLTFIRFSWVRE